MARTYDTVSKIESGGGFTTAQTWAHTIGSGSNRLLVGMATTEDFSTGGGGQEPSAFTYDGVALTKRTNGVVSAVQTAAIYDLLDTSLPAAGSYNFSISFSGEVDDLIAIGFSCDEVAQQAPEATATPLQTTGPDSTPSVDITTVTNNALILSVLGCSNHLRSVSSWNVGTQLEQSTGVLACMAAAVRYVKATAGAQTIEATLDASAVVRLAMVAVAYEEATGTPPTLDDPGDATDVAIGAQENLALTGTVTDGSSTTLRLQCTSGKGTVDLVDLDSGVSVSAGTRETNDVTFTGTPSQVQAALADFAYTGVLADVDTGVIVTIDDGINTPVSQTFTITSHVIVVTGTEANINLALGTLAATNSIVESTSVTLEATDTTARTGSNSSTIVTIVSNSGGNATSFTGKRRRRRSQ